MRDHHCRSPDVSGLPRIKTAAAPAKLTVQVDQPGHKIAPTLWGIFFEDINLSADGGLYPELVRNRSFEDSEKPEHWTLVQPRRRQERHGHRHRASHSARSTAAAPRACEWLRFTWQRRLLGHEPRQGRRLSGPARGSPQRTVFKGRSPSCWSGQIREGLAKGRNHRSHRAVEVVQLDLTASDTDPKGKLSLVAGGKGSLWLDMVSVMPKKTWKDHGLRPDLCEMLDSLKPSFVRFPGGCWVEGDDMAHMYRWKETIGDIAHRNRSGTSGSIGQRTPSLPRVSPVERGSRRGAALLHQRGHVAQGSRPDGPDGAWVQDAWTPSNTPMGR